METLYFEDIEGDTDVKVEAEVAAFSEALSRVENATDLLMNRTVEISEVQHTMNGEGGGSEGGGNDGEGNGEGGETQTPPPAPAPLPRRDPDAPRDTPRGAKPGKR